MRMVTDVLTVREKERDKEREVAGDSSGDRGGEGNGEALLGTLFSFRPF